MVRNPWIIGGILIGAVIIGAIVGQTQRRYKNDHRTGLAIQDSLPVLSFFTSGRFDPVSIFEKVFFYNTPTAPGPETFTVTAAPEAAPGTFLQLTGGASLPVEPGPAAPGTFLQLTGGASLPVEPGPAAPEGPAPEAAAGTTEMFLPGGIGEKLISEPSIGAESGLGTRQPLTQPPASLLRVTAPDGQDSPTKPKVVSVSGGRGPAPRSRSGSRSMKSCSARCASARLAGAVRDVGEHKNPGVSCRARSRLALSGSVKGGSAGQPSFQCTPYSVDPIPRDTLSASSSGCAAS